MASRDHSHFIRHLSLIFRKGSEMKNIAVYTLLILAVLLAACSPVSPQPASSTAAPTAQPTVTPTIVPTVKPTEAAVIDVALLANDWHWIGLIVPTQQIAIEKPENYTLSFQDNGTVLIKAACTNVTRNYTAYNNVLTFSIYPVDIAGCESNSRSDQFFGLLGDAARYHFKDGNLTIDLKADGGTLTFASPDALGGDDGAGMILGQPNTTSTLPADVTAQLDKWMQSLVSNKAVDPKMTTPGLVLLVDTPQGRYLSSAGVSSLEKNTPMKPDDRLEIGSNTKSFTVAILMQLQEEGLLSMDDLLSKWLPEWAAKLPNGDKITLRQMAQHTAGLWDYADDIIGGGAADPAALEKSYTHAELVQYAADKGQPYFAPGEGWHYSNTGYILLGMIAEKLTGQSLAELYQKRIFEPLGLQTAVLIEGVPQPGQITADGYWWNPDGSLVNTTNWNISQGWAAGGNAMTAADLATYGEGLAAGKLFKNADSLKQMLTFDERALMSLGASYGLGLFNLGEGYWGHAGQTLGFQSIWFTNPEEKITVVGLTNSANFSAQEFLNALQIVKQGRALPLPAVGLLPELAFPIDWEWVQTESPTGITEVQPGTVVTLIKDGTATVKNGSCGTYADGTYSVDADQHISFKFDAPDAACTTPGDAAQLADLLTHTAFWQFRDGYLAIELAVDGGTLLFKVKM
jgi:D-alanyl-D-alanine carboxypeptidase